MPGKKLIVLVTSILLLVSSAGCMKNNINKPEETDLEARYAEIMASAEQELTLLKSEYSKQIEQGIPFETEFQQNLCEKIVAAERACTPFHLYADQNYYSQYMYYIPFVDKDGIIQFIMDAVMQGDELKIGVTNIYMDDYIPLLNEIQYQNNDVIVYRYDKIRYIESREQVLPTASPWKLSFEEKKAIIIESEMNLLPLPTPGGHSLNDKVG